MYSVCSLYVQRKGNTQTGRESPRGEHESPRSARGRRAIAGRSRASEGPTRDGRGRYSPRAPGLRPRRPGGSMTELTDFLLARIAEDEADADSWWASPR